MARARNIKPAFFVNDDLAENNCALGRLLFIGLWTIADYKGDLEWRSGRIKTQLLPYDDCDIKKLAINLDKSGFVRFYSDGNKVYLNISNFMKHQNPHKNERDGGSEIPSFSDAMRQVVDLSTLTINRDNSGLKPNQDGTNPADSLIPITDPLLLNPSICDSEESPKKQAIKFSPPSKQDVWKFMYESGFGSEFEAERFVDHYTANGWKVGKNPMKDWKAAVRNWIKNQSQFKQTSRGSVQIDQIANAHQEFLNGR